MRMTEYVSIALMLLILVMLQGCGRKGPLYLPQQLPPQEVVAPAKVEPAPAASAPAASSSTQSPQ